MVKKVLLNLVIGLVSLIISYVLYYFVMLEYLINIVRFTEVSGVLTIITGMIFIYVIITLAFKRRINKFQIDLTVLAYFLMIISFSLFRDYNIQEIKLNPLELIGDFQRFPKFTAELLIANTFVYFPVGIYAGYRLKARSGMLTAYFLVYILIIEILQYVLKRGVFDIMDIVTNTFGFVAGAVLLRRLTVRRGKKY